MHTLSLPRLESIKRDRYAVKAERGDLIAICDGATDLVDAAKALKPNHPEAFYDWEDEGWAGDHGDVACEKLINGDSEYIAASDALMSKLEDLTGQATRTWNNELAPAGGAVHIGNYIAGNPLTMRRRIRAVSDAAPLTVVVDLSSSSFVTAETLIKRGSAILAFVRIISGARPVTLYAATNFFCDAHRQSGRTSCAVVTRIETAPLDLARAAYMLNNPAMSRHLGFSIITALDCGNQRHGSLPFPYCNAESYMANLTQYWARVFPGTEMLAVAPLYGKHATINPEAWIRTTLAKYGNTLPE